MSPPSWFQVPSDVKGPLRREMPIFGAFLNMSSRVPSKGALPRGPLQWAFSERNARILEPSSTLKAPGRRAPFRVPQRGPYGNRCPSPESFLAILQGPQQGSPPSRFPSQSSYRERRPTSRAPFSHLSKSPVDKPPSRFSSGAPGNRRPSPELFPPILQGPQQGSPPSRFPSQISHRERCSTSRAPFNHL